MSANKFFIPSFLLAILLTTPPLIADPQAPGVDTRQNNQQQRINQGVASGELTPFEQRRLNFQQKRIKHAENIAKADGVVTRGERFRLNQQQNSANRKIFRKKHNRRD